MALETSEMDRSRLELDLFENLENSKIQKNLDFQKIQNIWDFQSIQKEIAGK